MAGLVQVPAVEPERLLLGHVRKRYEQPMKESDQHSPG
jgi:hypothetical protein